MSIPETTPLPSRRGGNTSSLPKLFVLDKTEPKIQPPAEPGEDKVKAEEKIQDLTKEASRAAYHFTILQLIIFTVNFTGASSLRCRFSWMPLTLSATIGLANLWDMWRIQDERRREKDKRDRLFLQRLGHRLVEHDLPVIKYREYRRKVFRVVYMIPFVIILAVTVVSSKVFPCYAGAADAGRLRCGKYILQLFNGGKVKVL